jgi:hypothetical protein
MLLLKDGTTKKLELFEMTEKASFMTIVVKKIRMIF